MKKQIILFTFLHVTVACFAQDKSLPVFEGKTIEVNTFSVRSHLKQFTAFNLESAKLSNFVHQSALSGFRLNLGGNKVWDIDLAPSNIATSDYHLKILTSEGTKVLTSHPDFLFKGKVRRSSKDEQVRLTIKEGFIYGSIQTNGKDYFIEPLNRFTGKKEKDEFIVYEAKDVINGETLSCGFQDEQYTLKNAEHQNILKEQSPQGVICKKIKFISVADYSIFQKFGSDVYAVETALLSNLNMAEGAYATLNLGTDGSTDVGTDRLQFEMDQITVSVCKECDISPASFEKVADVHDQFDAWILHEFQFPYQRIYQLWTTRDLFDLNGAGVVGYTYGIFGCNSYSKNFLKYNSDDPAFLRVLVAHESGHAFGCRHDNQVKVSVTGFIMYSAANGSRTRFSTLADFGGGNYSSQQTMRNTVLQNIGCLNDCANSPCEEVRNLKVNYFNSSDSLQLSWTGNGNFVTQYKIEDSSYQDFTNREEVFGNTVTIRGLSSCTLYRFEVQKLCGADTGQTSSIIANTSSLSFTAKPINMRSDKYDLVLTMNCKNCSGKNYIVSIDKRPHFVISDSLSNVVIPDLFADGAPHRLLVQKDSLGPCRSESIFTAPYYRSNSSRILSADWNDCNMPVGWQDSLLAKAIMTAPDARWLIADKNFFTTKTFRGSFDSSCMIYYNNLNNLSNPYYGALSLTSPVVDLTKYLNTQLHFDYNFLSYAFPSSAISSSITVQVYDGYSWQTVMKRNRGEPWPRTLAEVRMIWDSLPSRVFIDLDKYRNKNLQVRFIADDGSLEFGKSTMLFAAFDNIQIDGYLADPAANDFMIYPNPTAGEVFIQFIQPVSSNIDYDIIDVNGRTIKYGVLNNYRIDLKLLTSGIYFLRLYQNNLQTGKTKKVIKQ